MIYDRTNIQISELCPLQFTEPRSTDFYPAANEYCGKISGSSDLVVQVLISEALNNYDITNLRICDINSVVKLEKQFIPYLLSTGYYYAISTITAAELLSLGRDFVGYFEVFDYETQTKLADSVWYTINPTFQNDLQEIEYTHEENDYNTVFKHGANTYKFKIWVEGGFIPKDERDEQEVEDFIQQDMVNETVYGDEYVVEPFTLGDNISGVPNWLRKKFSRISLLDSVKFKQMVNPSRNLVIDSLGTYSGINALHYYNLSEPLIVGQQYAVSVNGDVGAGANFNVWINSDITHALNLPATGIAKGTFVYQGGANPSQISVFSEDSANPSTVYWVQIEKGNIVTEYEPLENNDNEQVEYKRVSGAKLEKIEDTKNGLATYKIDLQTLNNYLQ